MISVRIELWPRGNRASAKHLGTVEISNVGGDRVTGSYEVELKTFNAKSVWRRARVDGFPREDLGGYDLVYRALEAAVGYRNRGLPVVPVRSRRDVEKRARAWVDKMPAGPWKEPETTALMHAKELAEAPEMVSELLVELERARGHLEVLRAALKEK